MALLAHCPFCGCATPRVLQRYNRQDGKPEWYVYCPECEARGPKITVAIHLSGAQKAANAWNRSSLTLNPTTT